MVSLVIVALALGSLAAPGSGDKSFSKARSCSDIRLFYDGKGFPLDGVPQSEISGEHLRICPQGYTCCTSDMEDNLAVLSRRETEGLLKEAGRSVQTSLTSHYKAFDGYFMDLLNRSAINLHETLTSALGPVYSQNSQVFSDLYADLRLYYRGSNVNLEEVLNEFWAKLLERLFYQEHRERSIGDDYLECVSKQIETLLPFRDIPRVTNMMVTHTFVAARSFVQGLVVGGEVVRKVSQVQLSQECMRSMMKMTYCPHCRGMASARPCPNYCRNVLKGCLANQADLNTEWRHLTETMMWVADRFDGPAGVDSVLLSLPSRISEAIYTMMTNIETINNKLFQSCGSLREGGTSSTDVSDIMKKGRVTVEDTLGSSSTRMDTLVPEVTALLRELQTYWVSLPNVLCNDRVATGTGAEEKCWNGMNRARYLPEVMGDGLASQINNPEVDIDITKPDITIRQQIMQLKIMTHRLKNALNGQDVDFQDTSDDVSGSGSGMCSDSSCSRSTRPAFPSTDQPVNNPYPPEGGKVKGAADRSLPSPTLYLLLLLMVLLRR
ncbi:glypican-1b [Betta splendens]|uniref:Glypican-1 n=1 Tax=Betta splendens TaxID=158456 RepID=A0A6P7KXX0_BETSP|nr:glypican-1b [Betta splendens]